MGCASSYMHDTESSGRQLDSYMTAEEIRLVKESWSIVRHDIEGVGVIMFKKYLRTICGRQLRLLFYKYLRFTLDRLFAMQEQLKKLFTSLLLFDGQSYLINEDKLRQHAKIVMEGLGAAVESLDDSIYLTNLLVAMGERHYSYNVKADMLAYLWPAIRDTLKEKLADDYSNDVERAWSHVFEYIVKSFQEGLRKGKQNGLSNVTSN